MIPLNKNKRRYHHKLYHAVLKDWYGEERGQREMVSYCPQTVELGDLVDKLMSKAIPADSLRFFELKEHWPELVGNQLAGFTEPLAKNKGTVDVAVSHPAWLRELQGPVKITIIENINRMFGEGFCSDLRFVPGGR